MAIYRKKKLGPLGGGRGGGEGWSGTLVLGFPRPCIHKRGWIGEGEFIVTAATVIATSSGSGWGAHEPARSIRVVVGQC